MINRDFINNLIDQCNIAEFIGEFVKLEKKGKNFLGICPFHQDSRPSLSVAVDKKVFNCFACNTKGGLLFFLKKFNNWTEVEALQFIATKKGIKLDSDLFFKPQDKVNYDEQQTKIIQIITKISQYFEFQLQQEIRKKNEIYHFLEKRNILNSEIIETFKIGYCPQNYVQKIQENFNVSIEELKKTTIILENEYPIFANRLIFPIKNIYGDIVGFSGRQIKDDVNKAKYINNGESLVFKKGEIIYNYHAISAECKEIFICEGFLDVISLAKKGIFNAVALMGTSFSDFHFKILKNYNLTIFLDSDPAGKKSTFDIINKVFFYDFSHNLSVVNNYPFKDPDEFANSFEKNIDFQKKIQAIKIDFLDFLVDYFYHLYQENNDKIYILRKLKIYVDKIKNSYKKNLFLESISIKNNIPLDVVKSFFGIKKYWKEPQKLKNSIKIKPKIEYDKLMFAIAKCIINNPQLSNFYISYKKDKEKNAQVFYKIEQIIKSLKTEDLQTDQNYYPINKNQLIESIDFLIKKNYKFLEKKQSLKKIRLKTKKIKKND